jgi:hypothetical protein
VICFYFSPNGWYAGDYAKRMNLGRFFIGIDTLPRDDPDKGVMTGLEFMKFFTDNTPIKNLWRKR